MAGKRSSEGALWKQWLVVCRRQPRKVVVIDAVCNKFGASKAWTEDQCDAFVVAQMGLSQEGGKILTLAT